MEQKRKRLSYACNYCCQRKTRCDDGQPSCRNCRVAGVQCITTNKRRAGAVVTSRRRASTSTSAGATPAENPAMRTPGSLPQTSPLPAASPGFRPPTQCWDRSGWRSGRLPMMPRFTGECMFEIMAEWLDLAFYRLQIPAPYSASTQPGPSVSVPVSVAQCPPALPSGPEMWVLGQRFLQTVCCIFPSMSEDEVYGLCESGSYEVVTTSPAHGTFFASDRAAAAWRREEWLPQTVDEAIEEKIHTGGELAALLEECWGCLPAEYRAGPFSQKSAFLS
ncbi:hypothetical protein BDW75DRAFT_244876 [Aspergillus navahoensis]